MKKYRFDQIAINSTKKKKPEENDRFCYIGLEHIDPGNFNISRWGAEAAPTGDKLLIKKGDVLFGKRRAYQRKVGIAPFDGIFSAHGMVLRPNEEIIDSEFFPFFISSDTFMDTAVRISVGGLSPTINWRDLAKQEFYLPSLNNQRILAKKLWAAYNLKQSYIKLLKATDEMVKSQFIEMFGDIKETRPLSEFISFSCPGEWGKEDVDGTGINVIRTTNFRNDGHLDLSDVVTRNIESKKIERKRLQKGDIILERSGGTSDNPVGRVVYFNENGKFLFNNFTQLLRCSENVESLYLFYSLFNYYHMNKNAIRSLGKQTTGIQNLKLEKYYEIPIVCASKELQERFVQIYHQADKSKFELKKCIENIDNVIKSLINQQ